MTHKTIGDRIKEKRLLNNVTQEELGKKAGVSKVTIHKYETNVITNIPSDRIKSIARALETTPAYLMGWENKVDNKDFEFVDLSNSVNIPVVGTIPAGFAMEAVENILGYIDIPADWTKGGKEYVGLKVSGDSMYPCF